MPALQLLCRAQPAREYLHQRVAEPLGDFASLPAKLIGAALSVELSPTGPPTLAPMSSDGAPASTHGWAWEMVRAMAAAAAWYVRFE